MPQTNCFRPWREASSKSLAHLPRHGPRRRPTSGKPSTQPGEPTMPLMCIRKRSTDGLRYEGIWACACGRSKDRLEIPRIENDHTFLATVLPIENLLSGSRVNSRSQSTPTRAPLSNRPQSRTNESLWLAGYLKTPGFDVRFGSKSSHEQSPTTRTPGLMISTANGQTRKFWERNIRLKTRSRAVDGPEKNARQASRCPAV